jgi:hypothetical protein
MSWSVSHTGTPQEVVGALREHSEGLSGQSKAEYEDALPHLVALVEQNFGREGEKPPRLTLSAHGSGSSVDGKQLDRECCVNLRRGD